MQIWDVITERNASIVRICESTSDRQAHHLKTMIQVQPNIKTGGYYGMLIMAHVFSVRTPRQLCSQINTMLLGRD
jgi:hypothetical protein